MKKLIRQPLIHFLLIGATFFGLFQLAADEGVDGKTIVVDESALMTYFQYRSKAFNPEIFRAKMASMSEEELQRLIEEYVREEVLFREAAAMDLDKDDYIIKRRMIQKIEFISQGIAETVAELTTQDLEQYYEDNKDKYYLQPFATFTHVFFEQDKWGESTEKMAQAELAFLNANNVPFSAAVSRGDRFYYHTNYVDRDPEYVASHFGALMANAIFAAQASDSQWIGPLQSEYGYHLVMVTTNEPGRYPDISEVERRVTDDAQRALMEKQNEAAIQSLVDKYEVRVVLEEGDEAKEKEGV